MQSDRHILPQATDIGQLANSNPLDPNFVTDTLGNLLGHSNYGISYSPYNGDGICKTQEEVNNDIAQLRQFAYVRFYGVDCNQAETISRAARRNNMQVFAGVFDIQTMDGDLQKIIDAADGDWSTFHTVSVGNELVNRGQSSPAEVVGAVNSARSRLREAGYQGPVVTVDTFNQIIAHPELCDASDYCAANCHAFFDSNQTPENAGPYVLEQARHISQATKEGNKRVIITETGWPSAGEANGAAVPSRHNQMVALRSLLQSFPDGGIVIFSAFNDKWKQDNAWTFGTEKNWGMFELMDTNGAIPGIVNPLIGDWV
jgi:exo-beta-1,3-glucanase (GH17 family)